MKIVEFIPTLVPGGAERFVVDLCNEMAQYPQHEIILLNFGAEVSETRRFYEAQVSDKIRYINVKRSENIIDKLICLWRVFKVIMKEKPNIVHCHVHAYSYALMPAIFLRKRTKYIQTNHNNPYKNIKPGLDKLIKTFFYKTRLIRLVTISPTCRKNYNEYMGFDSDNMIENGCRSISATTSITDVEKEIKQLLPSCHTVVFVNVARLQYQKHHELLVQAFNNLIDKGYDAILLQIGNKDANKDKLKILMEMDHSKRLFFLGPKKNVQDYLYQADAFCLSSRWEGAPISLLEASFCGCYPLCTPVCGCIDAIIGEDWGRMSKDESVEAYTELLESYIINKPQITRDKISKEYFDRYNMKTCAQKYLAYFESII